MAGLCSIADAATPGLSIDACVERLKRYHYALKRLHHLLTARITAEPIMELKTAFSHHAYLCSEHVLMLRDRVGEMREPPLGLEKIPHTGLEIFFDEVLGGTTEELLVGVYGTALPALAQALRQHMAQTNPLADAPTVRVLRFILLEVEDMIAFGRRAVACLVDDEQRRAMATWTALLADCLTAAGGIDGAASPADTPLVRQRSAKPYVYDPAPRRDERFVDLWNQGVNPEAFLHRPDLPADAKVLMLLFKRIREIDVPEMMASIIVQTEGKPWEYYRDMSRQLWDEARHAMMGEVGFVALGVDWTRCRITFNWSYRLNTECTPIERHAVLWFIEQGLMGKDGKRYEWEIGQASDFPLAATLQDYDWADEVLHAQIGRQWYVKDIGDRDTAVAYGDRCWSRILSNWQSVKDQGLTQHESWWPHVYRQACEARGRTPDAAALAFDTDYNNARADLQDVAHAMNSG